MTTPRERWITEIGRSLDRNLAKTADEDIRRVIETLWGEDLLAAERDLKALIQRFHRNRRRDLTRLLEERLAQPITRIHPRLNLLEQRYKDELERLSTHHIFQWSTFYRDFIGTLFSTALEHRHAPSGDPPILAMIATQIRTHATQIYEKGYRHLIREQAPPNTVITKALNGLERFLALPIEFYGTYAANVTDAAAATDVRHLCSKVIFGILAGYGDGKYGDDTGWGLLLKHPRSWAWVLGFLTASDAATIAEKLEDGQFRIGIQTVLIPALKAIDEVLSGQRGDEFSLPRLSEFVHEIRRLTISVSLPRAIARDSLGIHCYLSGDFIRRWDLEESVNRQASVVIAPLRPDLRDWMATHDILRTIVVEPTQSEEQDDRAVVRRILDILNFEFAKYLGPGWRAEPITVNLARLFPLEHPANIRFFLVHRATVQNLLQTFERDTGVRLWCSVRRSGKTTATFDLGSSLGNSRIITQTMEYVGQQPEANIFADAFNNALEAGTQLKRSFLRDVLKQCAKSGGTGGDKLVFVLDEYETLFERMKLAAARDRELRFTVVQPMLNQIVEFSLENLVILIGQRPDAHYIVMDQNQLSPYVRLTPFPLFEHSAIASSSEFISLLKKILTERVTFESAFADAVFAETSGHPYLTVNLMVDFFQWLIDIRRRASELRLTATDFVEFSGNRLTPKAIAYSANYEFFRNFIGESLGDDARRHTPWLNVMCSTIRQICQENPDTLSSPGYRFEAIATVAGKPYNWDAEYVLKTGRAGNFLEPFGNSVGPAIRLFGRIAAVTNPRIV
jgi:hypothetical protein